MKRLNPRDIVIVDAVRTAMGKSENGFFRHLNCSELSAQIIQGLLKRNSFDHQEIEDVIWGCVGTPANVAREAMLINHQPITGCTINRLAGSSMQALYQAAAQIATQQGDIFIVGGVESYPSIADYQYKEKAAFLARMHGITSEQQDLFAVQSHQRAWLATQDHFFNSEIVPIQGHQENGFLAVCEQDELIQANANIDALRVSHATFASHANGASAILMMSAERAKNLNLKPRAVVRAMATAGCEPTLAGYALVPSIQKALQRANLKIKNINTLEIHESSASDVLTCLKAFNLLDKQDKVNRYGGAIALGSALGSTGTRTLTTLLNSMEKQNSTFGMASLTTELGEGMTTIIERV